MTGLISGIPLPGNENAKKQIYLTGCVDITLKSS